MGDPFALVGSRRLSLAQCEAAVTVAGRRCSRCGRTRPLSEFNWKDTARRRRQAYCRPCMKAAWRRWYANEQNRARHLAQVAGRRRRRTKRHQELITRLKSHPCADCGNRFPPYVMDFDHVRDKTTEVSRLVRTYGTARLMAEIERCDVVCANCHRIRTHKRFEAGKAPRRSERRNELG
jgi:hypothetical protein